jgi:hypothetical protein
MEGEKMAKKKISVQSAKAKGRKLQQWTANMISRVTGLPWGKDELIASREMGQSGVDVRLVGVAKMLFPYSVECKAQEKWQIHEWIKQARENEMENTTWLLVAKRNHEKPIVAMDAERFFMLWSQVLDMTSETFGYKEDKNVAMMEKDYEIKDSGEHRKFESGAQRDNKVGKGRYDLLPPFTLHALAIHYQKGAMKYEDRNWEQGMPLSEFYDSAMRHMNEEMMGLDDENHAIAWVWNALCYYETKHRIQMGLLPKELDDMPKYIQQLKHKIKEDVELIKGGGFAQ